MMKQGEERRDDVKELLMLLQVRMKHDVLLMSNSCVCVPVQVSALDQELIEVDPDTKEMLKLLVSLSNSSDM